MVRDSDIALDGCRGSTLTVGDVRLLLLVAFFSLAHHPAAVASVAVRAEDVAPVLRPPHALQLLRVTRRQSYSRCQCLHSAPLSASQSGSPGWRGCAGGHTASPGPRWPWDLCRSQWPLGLGRPGSLARPLRVLGSCGRCSPLAHWNRPSGRRENQAQTGKAHFSSWLSRHQFTTECWRIWGTQHIVWCVTRKIWVSTNKNTIRLQLLLMWEIF